MIQKVERTAEILQMPFIDIRVPAARMSRDPVVRELHERVSDSELEEKEFRCRCRFQHRVERILIATRQQQTHITPSGPSLRRNTA